MDRERRQSASAERGVTGVEYALILGVFALIIGFAVGPLTAALGAAFDRQVTVPGPEICVGGNCSLSQGPFTVSYSANGAVGTPPGPAEYAFGASVTISANTGLSKSGFTFAGWNTGADGSGQPYAPGQSFSMPGNDVALYAVWAGKYSLAYNGNGNTSGTPPVDSKSPYDSGSLVTLKAPGTLTKDCSAYAGWNTRADGTGSWYAATGKLLMPAGDLVLYAQWTALPRYTMAYDGNGSTAGDAPSDGQSPYCGGSTVMVLANSGNLSRTGYTFAGWNTRADGTGTAWAAGQTFTITADTHLYAQWTLLPPTQCTVSYIANGGNGTIASQTMSCGVAVTLSTGSGLTRLGYTVHGWNTATDGSGAAYATGATVTVTNDITLYAQWVPQCPAALTVTTLFTKNAGSGTHDLGLDLPVGNPGLTISSVIKTSGVGTIALSSGTTYRWTYPNGAKQVATASIAYGYANQTCVATWSLSTP